MKKVQSGALPILHFEHLSQQKEVQHWVTTRAGGVSQGAFGSLNLGGAAGDAPENVLENRQRLEKSIPLAKARLLFPNQVHGKRVLKVDAQTASSECKNTDALITQTPGLGITVLSADCTPLLFFDPVTRAVGAAHAGWRGTVQGIAQHTVRAMQEHFGSRSEDLYVGIAPCISPARYEVGGEVIVRVREVFPEWADRLLLPHSNSQKAYLDLRAANQLQLEAIGVLPSRIEVADLCTFEEETLFFSARRQGIQSGRFGAGICLERDP